GGQADFGVIAGQLVLPAIHKGDVRLMGWVGDETPWQIGAIFTSTKEDNENHALIEKFLRAFRKGAQEYHDAFTGPGETRRDGPTEPEVMAVMAKYTGQPVDQLKQAIA